MSTLAAPAPPRSPLEIAAEHFRADTADHQMTILREEGLYRHVRFRNAGRDFRCYEVSDVRPGNGFYQFDLVTWPGYLAFVGDAGDFVFRRLPDMFEFFSTRGGFISYDYWAEKLVAPAGSEAVRSFSEDRYRRQVEEWIAEQEPEVAEAARAQLLDEIDFPHDSDSAHRLLYGFAHEGITIPDVWEWEFRDYEHRYLWACCAIAWGVDRYLSATGGTRGPA